MTKMTTIPDNYDNIRAGIVELLKAARSTAARNVNSIMTAVYWDIGRRIVRFEQRGEHRAEYGEQLIEQLSADLTRQFGRGFGRANLWQMRAFYRAWPEVKILQTLSGESTRPLAPDKIEGDSSTVLALASRFPLPWSAYVRLLSVTSPQARGFYETEAVRSGWSIRQLDRQIGSQFYERIALSQNKAAMLDKAENPEPSDLVTPEEAIKDPFVLEFLDLKDEYSESELEEALIHRLTDFLLELGDDFAFLGRQRRLRIGSAREAFADTYPFHPSVLSVFERKWQGLPRFQQTRGILRLLALWVSHAYQAGFKGGHRDPLIGLGTAPLDDSQFRAAMFEQLGEHRLEAAVTTDICGKNDSHAVRLDNEAVEAIRKARLHRKVATTIFFESNGGMSRAEATSPEIRLAVAEPDIDIGHVETVLEALTDACATT